MGSTLTASRAEAYCTKCPVGESCSGRDTHKPIGATFAAIRAEAYCTKCPVGHRIVMFLVCLYVFGVVVDFLSSHGTSW
jgi:hypothetical protein